MANDLEVFRAALAALFGTDPIAQQQANQWLNGFSTSPAAWEAAFSTLEPSAPDSVAFFCANLLLSKLRNEWHKLESQHKELALSQLSGKLNAFVSSQPTSLATARICMALAAAAANSSADKALALAQHALSLANAAATNSVQLSPALALLTSLAEEVDQQDRSRRGACTAQLATARAQVLALLQLLLRSSPSHTRLALQCLSLWLQLGTDQQGGCCLSPQQMMDSYRQLLEVLFQLLSQGEQETIAAAAEVLAALLGPGKDCGSAAAEVPALQYAVQKLCELQPQIQAPGEQGGWVAAAVARVAVAVSERDVDLATGNTPVAQPLAQLMLACAARPEHAVLEWATDYFLMVNTVPTDMRQPFLRHDIYAQLAPLLLAHARYPADFTSWEEEAELDEEAFTRFREQCLPELVETAYAMTGLRMLELLRGSLQSCASWQACEAVLCCLRCMHVPLRSRALGRDGHAPHPEQQPSAAFLQDLFRALCSVEGPGTGLAPWLAAQPGGGEVYRSAAGLVGDYAAWFAKRPEGELRAALLLLLNALGHRQAGKQAAAAFRSICSRCSSELSRAPQLLADLIAAATRQVAPPPAAGQAAGPAAVAPEDCASVVEGLARAVASLEPEQAAEAGQMLVRPLVERAQSVISHGNMAGAAGQQLLQVLAADLRLMGCAIHFMEFPRAIARGAGHPALRVLQGCWPVVAAVAQSPLCQQHQEVVAALCEVYQRTLLSTKSAAKPLLQEFITPLVAIFCAQLQPACLEPLATVVEVFGEVRSAPEVAALQCEALQKVCTAVAAALQRAGSDVAAHGELLAALLTLADRHVIFAVDTVLDSPSLPTLLHLAIRAAALRERPPVQAALAFLQHLLHAWEKLQQQGQQQDEQQRQRRAAQAQQCLQAQGAALAQALLLGALDTCPRQQLRPLAGCLHTLLAGKVYRPAAAQWVQQVLQRGDLPGMQAGLLKAEDCGVFCSLALAQPAMMRGRFDALVQDFANIARGEGSSDALLGYQL